MRWKARADSGVAVMPAAPARYMVPIALAGAAGGGGGVGGGGGGGGDGGGGDDMALQVYLHHPPTGSSPTTRTESIAPHATRGKYMPMGPLMLRWLASPLWLRGMRSVCVG